MVRLTDTLAEAERVLTEVHRNLPPARKWLQLGEMYRAARLLHEAGVRIRKPDASAGDVVEDWMALNLGVQLPVGNRRTIVEPSSLRDVREVLAVLTRLGIEYALGGSIASSLYGRARTTRDADLTVEPFPGNEQAFVEALGPDYYASVSALEEANRQRSSCNVINTMTGFKVDLFVRKDTEFECTAMARRRTFTFPDQPEQPIIVQAPEDVILFKLRCYQLGGEVSEQHWRDVWEVLQTQAGKLDNDYLDRWAPELGVAELLQRVREES